MDLATGVTAIQPFHIDTEILHLIGRRNWLIMESRLCVFTSGATHEDLSLVLAIEI